MLTLSGAPHVRWNWLPGSLSADGAMAGIWYWVERMGFCGYWNCYSFR
jgi:hypothetical protein